MKRQHIAVLGALTIAATSAFVGTQLVSGASTADETVFIPIAPCRLLDTRPGDTNVGPVATPIGPGQDVTFTAWGTGDADSPCNIPNTATAIATNTTAVGPTARTFLTLYPTDVANPGTSNLNVLAGQAPTPNSANIPLSTTGKFNVFNNAGTVNVIIDINGYYQPSSAIGQPGPSGPAGPQGPAGGTNTGHNLATVDATNVSSFGTSAAIGTNGNPIIGYRESVSGLNVAACDNPTCTAATITPLDPSGSSDMSIVIGLDGNPVISYRDGATSGLKVAACTNPACTAATITPFDTGGTNVLYTSIAIGTDGNPVISYQENTIGEVKVAACTNPACTTATITPLDAAGTVGGIGSDTAITIGGNGNPIISYHEKATNDLKVAACTNPACTTATITPLDTDGFVSFGLSITTGMDGNAIISYYDATGSALKAAACTNPTCTAATITSLDDSFIVGFNSSITIGTDGNPVISYYDSTNEDLKIAACTNPTCTAAAVTPLDIAGDIGRHTSIVIGLDGRPVISYYDSTNGDLKVAVCGNATCAPYPGNNR